MEHIVDTFSNGLKNLKDNTVIFLPLLVYTVFVSLLSLVGLVPGYYILTADDPMSLLPVAFGLLFVFLFIVILISCYVSAGTIGMAKEAIATGTTSFKDMTAYGKKYTIRIFVSTILLSIIQFVSVIFWIPLYFAYKNAGYTIEMIIEIIDTSVIVSDAFYAFLATMFVSFMIGLLLTFIYLIIVSFIFYFVSYAIVVDDMPVIAAFKKSFALLRQYPGRVIFFILLIVLLTFALSSIVSIISVPLSMFQNVFLSLIGSLIQTLFSVAVGVAAIVWTTRFYMDITEKELYTEENLLEF